MKYLNLIIIAAVMLLVSCGKNKDNFEYELLPVKMDQKWGYIDNEGKIVINPQFDEAFLFSNGLSLVKAGALYGYIGSDGKYVINPMYKNATYFADGLALVATENGYPTFINKKGEIKFTVNEADECRLFAEDLAAFKSNSKWGFIDNSGKIIINAQFDRVGDFKEGMALFASDINMKMQYGYINKKGEIAINAQFEEASPFQNGLALVKVNNKYGFIDKSGKFVINAQFDYAEPFSEDLALIKSGEKFGYIDKSGKIVINPQFDKVGSFKEGLALAVSIDEKFGYINQKGNFEINAQFDEARPFNKKLAAVKINNKYGFIDKTGKIIINPQFDGIFDIRFYKNYIYSDYFNTKSLEAYFLDKTEEGKFRRVDKNTTFGAVSNDIHKNDELLETTNNTVIVKVNKDIDNYVKIETFKYTFKDNIYTIKPTFKYLHHWGNYPTGNKKEMNFNAPVKSVEVEMYLYGKASGKNQKVVSVLAKIFADLMKTTPKDSKDGLLVESPEMNVEVWADNKLLTGKVYLKASF